MIPGHEFIGHVVGLGADVEGFELGDRVTSEQIVPCWGCRFCNHGQYWMCENTICTASRAMLMARWLNT